MRRALVATAAALCCAFVAVRDDDANRAVVWGSTPVTYVIQQNGSDDVSDSSDIAAIRDAFALWGSPGCTSFAFADGGLVATAQTEAALSQNDGVNRIGFLESTWVTGADSAIGLAFRRRTITAGVDDWIDNDILMNGVDATWATDGNPDDQDIQSVIAHELGHCLGLQHSPHPQATMYFRGSRGTAAARTLHADDIAGVCYLYPSGAFSCTGDDECPLLHDAFETYPSVRTVCSGGSCVVGTVDYGEACFANGQCSSGLCLAGLDTSPLSNAGFCTEGCTAGSCASGDWCETNQGYCLLGYDDCWANADCGGGNFYCIMDKDLRFRCRETCLNDGHCSGDVCDGIRTLDNIGFCRPPGPGAGGAACDSGLECESLSCSTPGVAPTCREWCETQVDDTACDDGNGCTSGETCQAGSCGSPTSTETCPAPNGCTNAGTCDPSDGSCSYTYNTTPCDDGDACTEGDVCDGAGGCAGTDLDCDDSDACTTDGCAAGACTHTAIGGCCNDAGDCDDSDPCTTNTCSGPGGTCSFPPIANCCEDASDCDDSDDCTTDTCPVDRCLHVPAPTCADGGAPDGGAPDGGAPDGGAPDGAAPDGAAPDGAAPDGAAPDGAAPDGAAPDGAAPDGAAPDGAAPDGGPTGDPHPAGGDGATSGGDPRFFLPEGLHLSGNCACSSRGGGTTGWILVLAGAIVGVRRKGRRTG